MNIEPTAWAELAKSLHLKDRGDDEHYRGTCPFCDMERVFCINSQLSYARCLVCDKGGNSLDDTLLNLYKLSQDVEVPEVFLTSCK